MKTIDNLESATLPDLKTLIGPTDGTKNIVNCKLDIRHRVESSIPPQILRLPSLPTVAVETEAFMVPEGISLQRAFGFFGRYEKVKLTQHQILEYVIGNWETIRKNIHALAFVTETELGHALFYLIVSEQKDHFVTMILPMGNALVPINDPLAAFVVPKKD